METIGILWGLYRGDIGIMWRLYGGYKGGIWGIYRAKSGSLLDMTLSFEYMDTRFGAYV